MFRLLQISALAAILITAFSCFNSSSNKTEESGTVLQEGGESKKEFFLLYPGLDQNLHPTSVFLEEKEEKVSQLESILTEYLAQTPQGNLINPFPSNSKLRAVYLLSEDKAVVDLSSMAIDGGGVEEETFRIYGIINTINYNFPEIKAVKIIVEGRERETFMGHIDVSEFIPPEPSLNGKDVK